MSSIRSRLYPALIIALFVTLSVQASLAQAPTIVRTVLAVASLPSVVDAPLFFKLSRVELPSGQITSYSGPVPLCFIGHADGADECWATIASAR